MGTALTLAPLLTEVPPSRIAAFGIHCKPSCASKNRTASMILGGQHNAAGGQGVKKGWSGVGWAG